MSVNILRVDELCRASLLRIKGPLRHLTLRLLFRPDQQLDDDDDEEEDDVEGDNPKPTPGDGLARLAQVCAGAHTTDNDRSNTDIHRRPEKSVSSGAV